MDTRNIKNIYSQGSKVKKIMNQGVEVWTRTEPEWAKYGIEAVYLENTMRTPGSTEGSGMYGAENWIDTGHVMDRFCDIEVKYQNTSPKGGLHEELTNYFPRGGVLGYYPTGLPTLFIGISPTNLEDSRFVNVCGNIRLYSDFLTDNTFTGIHTSRLNLYEGYFQTGDKKNTFSIGDIDLSETTTLPIFRYIRSFEYYFVGRIYGMSIKRFGKEICNLVPIKLTLQSVTDTAGRVHEIGSYVMWDTVTNTVPAHYGTFLGSTVFLEDESLYHLGTPLDSIICTGQQALDTGIVIDSEYSRIKTIITRTNDTPQALWTNKNIFYETSEPGTSFYYYNRGETGSSEVILYSGITSKQVGIGVGTPIGVEFKIDYTNNNGNLLYSDGIYLEVDTTYSGTVISPNILRFFKTQSSLSFEGECKGVYVEIREGVPTFNGIPFKTLDGRIGFLDTISRTLFESSTGTSFIEPSVSAYSLLELNITPGSTSEAQDNQLDNLRIN